MIRKIAFDMDGTIADLYGNENWLEDLENELTRPYREAKSLLNMRTLGRELNRIQTLGYEICIISWLSRTGSAEYNERVTQTKLKWLSHHIGAVEWDEIHIVPYGTPKSSVVECDFGILFDDEKKNRDDWTKGQAFDETEILEILKELV